MSDFANSTFELELLPDRAVAHSTQNRVKKILVQLDCL